MYNFKLANKENVNVVCQYEQKIPLLLSQQGRPTYSEYFEYLFIRIKKKK